MNVCHKKASILAIVAEKRRLFLKKYKIDNARLYVAAQNLWTITGYSGYDPEVSIRSGGLTPGLDFSSYPRALSVSFGINLGF